jgi:hypothetical protein
MLSVAHAGAIEADRLLNRITQSRQPEEGDTRLGLADRSNVGVGTRRCQWAFKQDMPQVVTRPIVAVIAQMTRLSTHWHRDHDPQADSIRTRARRFLRCIPSQVCFELLTRTRTRTEECQ